MDEDLTSTPRPTWSALEAIPIALAAFAGTAVAGLLLPLILDVATSFVLVGLVFEAGLVGFTLLWVRFRPDASRAALGLTRRRVWVQLAVGVVAGLLLFAVTVFVIAPALYGLISLVTGEQITPPRQQVLPQEPKALHRYLGAFVVVLAAPVGEEVFFRGFLFGGLRRRMSFWAAAVVSAAIFAAFHIQPLLMPLLFVVGLGLAFIYERRESLAASIGAHAGFNLVGYLLILSELG